MRVSPSDELEKVPSVRVAVIDVGSNSVRLMVASVRRSGEIRELERERVYLRLGDDAYRLGRIGSRKLDELAETAGRYARLARAARAERIETIVTAPGRQAGNADELVELLRDVTRAPVVILTAEDEGRLAWQGAVSLLDLAAGDIAVVDLGGGSCEVAIGRRETGPTAVYSRDAGALRVTRAFLPPRPTQHDLECARSGVRELLDGVAPARPDVALAVGGTARALGKVLGPRYGPRKLEALADRIVELGTERLTRQLDVTPARSETLLGGTLVLAELARRLESKLEVGRGGLREGAVLALARLESVAA